MENPYTLDTDSRGSTLSKNAWILIIFAILFLLYAFVPPIQDPINSMFGGLFGPVIDMFTLAGDSLSYL